MSSVGEKRARIEGEDILVNISEYLSTGDIDQLRALNIDNKRLVEEIRNIDPSFSLEEILLKKRRKNVGAKIYEVLSPYGSISFTVDHDRFISKGAIPKNVSQMYIRIGTQNAMDKEKVATALGIPKDTYLCREKKMAIRLHNFKDVLLVDIEDLSLPEEILSAHYKTERNSSHVTFSLVGRDITLVPIVAMRDSNKTRGRY